MALCNYYAETSIKGSESDESNDESFESNDSNTDNGSFASQNSNNESFEYCDSSELLLPVETSSKITLKQIQKVALTYVEPYFFVYVVKIANETPSPEERFYSLKCWSKTHKGYEEYIRTWVQGENEALQELAGSGCPFIISLLDTYEDNNFTYFLSDFDGGALKRYMIKKKALTNEECKFFAANIVSAVSHLHHKGFVHRDIRTENFCIGGDGYLKLVDLSYAKRLPYTVQLPSGQKHDVTHAHTLYCLPEFLAPEQTSDRGYTKVIDWWSLGCIIVELYCGSTPYDYGDFMKTHLKVANIEMGQEKFISPAKLRQPGLQLANDFVRSLLVKADSRLGRFGSHEVEEHKYFSGIDFAKLRKKELKAPCFPRKWDTLFSV